MAKNLRIDPEKEAAAIDEINHGKARMDELEREEQSAEARRVADVNAKIDAEDAYTDIANIRADATNEVNEWFSDPTQAELSAIKSKYGRSANAGNQPVAGEPGSVQNPSKNAAYTITKTAKGDTIYHGADGTKTGIRNGKGYTIYGGKVRVVDQGTGAVSWMDTKGNAIAVPDSEAIRGKLGGDIGNVRKSFSSWSDLAAQQKAEKDAEENERWKKQAEFDSKTLEQRKRMKGERNHMLADAFRRTWNQLNMGKGDIKETKDGRRYRIVMFRGDGKEDNVVSQLNRMNEDMGRHGRMTSIAAAIEVDQNGDVETDDNGNPVRPVFKYGFSKDGEKKATSWKELSASEIMDQWANTYADMNGKDITETRRVAVESFGGDANLAGRNPAGWNIAPTSQEKFAAEYAARAAANGNKAGKSAGGEAKFDKNLFDALRAERDSLMYTEGVAGTKTKRNLSAPEQRQLERINSRIRSMLGYGDDSYDDIRADLQDAANRSGLSELEIEATGIRPGGAGGEAVGDEDITLSDGSQGKKHNGKTYRLKGTDKNGNRQWELVK